MVFSKYPVEKVDEDSGFGQENTYGIMVSVDAGEKGKFYVANVHLLSYMITDNEIDLLLSSAERQKLDTLSKKLLHKLNFAFQRRSEELQPNAEGWFCGHLYPGGPWHQADLCGQASPAAHRLYLGRHGGDTAPLRALPLQGFRPLSYSIRF